MICQRLTNDFSLATFRTQRLKIHVGLGVTIRHAEMSKRMLFLHTAEQFVHYEFRGGIKQTPI